MGERKIQLYILERQYIHLFKYFSITTQVYLFMCTVVLAESYISWITTQL